MRTPMAFMTGTLPTPERVSPAQHFHASDGQWYFNDRCPCPLAGRPDDPDATTHVTIAYRVPDSEVRREWQHRVATDRHDFAILRAGATFYRQFPAVTILSVSASTSTE